MIHGVLTNGHAWTFLRLNENGGGSYLQSAVHVYNVFFCDAEVAMRNVSIVENTSFLLWFVNENSSGSLTKGDNWDRITTELISFNDFVVLSHCQLTDHKLTPISGANVRLII